MSHSDMMAIAFSIGMKENDVLFSQVFGKTAEDYVTAMSMMTKAWRLKNFMGKMECYDIQAAFPMIMKEWIVSVEEV